MSTSTTVVRAQARRIKLDLRKAVLEMLLGVSPVRIAVGLVSCLLGVSAFEAGPALATTQSFTTAGCSTWTVPSGVSSVNIAATGSAGADGSPRPPSSSAGGTGDVVSAILSGLPAAGQQLYVCVDVGGGPGGVSNTTGGAGGGASGVGLGGDFSAPALIAAGGGGGAFGQIGGPAGDPNGNAGGSNSDVTVALGYGGGGGTQTGVGAGGAFGGTDGSAWTSGGPGTGGTGGSHSIGTGLSGGEGGGGGGAGYYGGGGGGATIDAGFPPGGGGGGSDFCASVLTGATLSGCGVTGSNSAFGTASVTISWLATPSISTTQDPASATVGSQIRDVAKVSGGADTAGGKVTFNLYNNPNATGTPLFTDTESVDAFGLATSNGYTTTAAGTDYWVATYNADANNESASSSTSGEPVTITPATPSISTAQQPASATAGSSVADQATVSAGYSPTGTVTFNLYNNPNGTGTPLFTDTETLSGGSATSKGYTTAAAGTDYWVATYNGDANNNPVSSSTSGEPVTITTASKLADLSVAISGPSSAADGSAFSEQVTVSNAGPASAANVVTALIVPDGATVTSTGGGTLAFGVVYWTAGQIASHAKVIYTVTFKVAAHASGKVLIPAATASLSNPDPDYANNAAATTVTLGGRTAHSESVQGARNPLAVGKRLPALLRQLIHRHALHHRRS